MAMRNTTKSMAACPEMLLMPNMSGVKNMQKAIPPTMTAIKTICRVLNGFATFARIMKPTRATSMVQEVEIHSALISKTCPNTTRELTLIKVVMPAGAAILNTFPKKEPLIRFLLGSRDRTKDGTPMVNMLIRVIWDGFSG